MSAKKTIDTKDWDYIRDVVYRRDDYTCFICRESELDHPDCGHIVDRLNGGSDEFDNLVVMCENCNRHLKPLHKTKDEFFWWCAEYIFQRTVRQAMYDMFQCRDYPEADGCVLDGGGSQSLIIGWTANFRGKLKDFHDQVVEEYDLRVSRLQLAS